jgi:hypothetical protein
MSVRDSSVHALEAVRGTVSLLGVDDLSLPPLNLLGAIGLPLVAPAVLLELLHLLRQRRVRVDPAHPATTHRDASTLTIIDIWVELQHLE